LNGGSKGRVVVVPYCTILEEGPQQVCQGTRSLARIRIGNIFKDRPLISTEVRPVLYVEGWNNPMSKHRGDTGSCDNKTHIYSFRDEWRVYFLVPFWAVVLEFKEVGSWKIKRRCSFKSKEHDTSFFIKIGHIFQDPCFSYCTVLVRLMSLWEATGNDSLWEIYFMNDG
jgi:hypothetical protein